MKYLMQRKVVVTTKRATTIQKPTFREETQESTQFGAVIVYRHDPEGSPSSPSPVHGAFYSGHTITATPSGYHHDLYPSVAFHHVSHDSEDQFGSDT